MQIVSLSILRKMRKKRLIKPYQSIRSKKKKIKVDFKSEMFYFLSCLGVVATLSFAAISINYAFTKPRTENAAVLPQSRDVYREKKFWIEILNNTPDYLPGILEMAKIEYELGNKQAAYDYFTRAKSINPNDERVKITEGAILNTKN